MDTVILKESERQQAAQIPKTPLLPTTIHNYNDFRGNPALLHSLAKSCQGVLESSRGARNGQLDAIWSDRIHAVMHHRAHQADF